MKFYEFKAYLYEIGGNFQEVGVGVNIKNGSVDFYIPEKQGDFEEAIVDAIYIDVSCSLS